MFLMVGRLGNNVQVDLINRQTATQEALVIPDCRVDVSLVDAVVFHKDLVTGIALVGPHLDKDTRVSFQGVGVNKV